MIRTFVPIFITVVAILLPLLIVVKVVFLTTAIKSAKVSTLSALMLGPAASALTKMPGENQAPSPKQVAMETATNPELLPFDMLETF